jgi:hypothetical protein
MFDRRQTQMAAAERRFFFFFLNQFFSIKNPNSSVNSIIFTFGNHILIITS